MRVKDCTNKQQFVVGVYYKPPDKGEPVDETFLLQLQEVSCSHTLILMGDFNHLSAVKTTQQSASNPEDY